MLLGVHPNRACIYFIYDKDGIIDDYILYQLKDMRENVSFLHCVINGKLTAEGKKALSQIADEVYVRENKGNDIGAYKAAIKHIGWKKLFEYDELVLMNNTCFGPIYPFKEVFGWASGQDVDFWGLTWGKKANWLGNENYLHYHKSTVHIQSYFLAIRRPLLQSDLIQKFFDEIPEDTDYVHSGSFYEYAFPGYFEEKGYRGAVYCDDRGDFNYPLLHNPVDLLRHFRMPLIKKRSFFHHYTDVLGNTAGEATAKLLRFLKEETTYDVNLIWSSILRTSSLSDLVRCVQLNRVLPRDMYMGNTRDNALRVGVVYHAFYEDLFDESLSYLGNFPSGTDLLITTTSEEKKDLLEEKMRLVGIQGEVHVVVNRGRDISALLVDAKDFISQYDLVCFSHDKKTTAIKPLSVGRSWRYKLNENMFATKEYIANVVSTFENEPRLGIAFPSPPNHGMYATSIGSGWTINFKNTQRLLKDFGVDVKINEHTLCVCPLGTCFWFRPLALDKLLKGYHGEGWHYSDFPREPNRSDGTILHAIERAYAYFAQDAGYYPAYLYNDKFAEIELTNLEFNKTGSTEMRGWVEALAMEAIGYLGENGIAQSAVQMAAMYPDQNINYGVKRSLVHLATALRYKYPRLWACLLPLRRLTQKVLNIKTR